MTQLLVSELFFSIQGEGSRVGLPCVFLRLQGCSLRCAWCDTPYALDRRAGGELRDTDALAREIARFRCRFVMLTGGEPLEQEEALPFITRLCDDGYTVAVETGGHADISRVDPRAVVILDVKCPGSGMAARNRLENLGYVKPTDEIKFVVRDREDFLWARDFIAEHRLPGVCRELLVAPAFGACAPHDLAAWILDEHLPVRLQLQVHKHIWPPDTRGV
jgi:7-carboxy-7-deazaguanine synthase